MKEVQRIIKKEYGSIYAIKNDVNEKMYIGRTVQTLEKRFSEHLSQAKKKDAKLQQAMREIGVEHFYIEEICKVPVDELYNAEEYFVDFYNTFKYGYNGKRGGKSGNITTPAEEERIIQYVKNGFSRKEIGLIFNISENTVSKVIHKHGCYYPTKVDIKEISKLYDEGLSLKEISQKTGFHKRVIGKNLNKNGKRYERTFMKYRDDFDVESFRKDYEMQMPIKDICKKYNMTKNTVYRTRKKYEIPKRKLMNNKGRCVYPYIEEGSDDA